VFSEEKKIFYYKLNSFNIETYVNKISLLSFCKLTYSKISTLVTTGFPKQNEIHLCLIMALQGNSEINCYTSTQ